MLITGEGMADQHRVAALRVERAIGLIGDLKGGEIDAGIEPQRLLPPEAHEQRAGIIRLVRAARGINFDAENGLRHLDPNSEDSSPLRRATGICSR